MMYSRKPKKLAKRLNISNSELFPTGISSVCPNRGLLQKCRKRTPVREKLDSVYSEQPSEVDEALLRMQFASLPKEVW